MTAWSAKRPSTNTVQMPSAAWGHRVKKNLAMAHIDPVHTKSSTEVEVLLIGDTIHATVCSLCPFDP